MSRVPREINTKSVIMMWVTLLAGVLLTRGEPPPARDRYGFYRDVHAAAAAAGGARRVFGGKPVPRAVFPAACRLTDGTRRTRCSGAVLAPRWALTAAHCLTAGLAYVEYNARSPGPYAAVQHLYRHPQYRVIHEDEGRGMDVTLLHHDVGLVQTHTDMILNTPPPPDYDPLLFMRKYNTKDLNTREVQVLGFGRTEDAARGEQLSSARLRLTPCARSSWLQCACGAARGPAGGARGVCAGDSGGPVLYRGGQVGVTSMGPLSCASSVAAATDATSVFTALYYYVDLLNDTMRDADDKLRMTKLNSGWSARAVPASALLAALLVASPALAPAPASVFAVLCAIGVASLSTPITANVRAAPIA